jgi:hypothetical protein
MKNTTYRFRCIPNPSVIYVPAEMYDVEGMRGHPEYEEIDAEGNVIAKSDAREAAHRIPMSFGPKAAPKVKGKRK